MKLILSIFILTIGSLSSLMFGQIRTNNATAATIVGQSAFLDASATSFSQNSNTSNGKGLVFPRTNLTTFSFATPTTSFGSFPTVYDGMIVYNTASGTTPTTGSGIGGQAVEPGFYYFSNPTAGLAATGGNGNYNSSQGRWLPLGGAAPAPVDPTVDVLATETKTNLKLAGAQVYAVKGTFTTTGSSTSVTITPPSGMTSLYSITIYKSGSASVYSRDLYSYNISNGTAITGSPSMSVVYPQDTYDYVLEYLK